MGVVYLATDRRLGRRVALKVIVPELAADAQFRRRFEREARVAATLEHPHVVPVYEAGEQDGSLFIAMRFIDGRDLATEVRDHGALAPDRLARVVLQVAGALDAAHRSGVVHRDVKPANVLLTDRRGRAGLPHRLRPDARGRLGERPDADRPVGRHRRLRGARADPRRADRRALRRLRAGLPGLPGADGPASVPRGARRAAVRAHERPAAVGVRGAAGPASRGRRDARACAGEEARRSLPVGRRSRALARGGAGRGGADRARGHGGQGAGADRRPGDPAGRDGRADPAGRGRDAALTGPCRAGGPRPPSWPRPRRRHRLRPPVHASRGSSPRSRSCSSSPPRP